MKTVVRNVYNSCTALKNTVIKFNNLSVAVTLLFPCPGYCETSLLCFKDCDRHVYLNMYYVNVDLAFLM